MSIHEASWSDFLERLNNLLIYRKGKQRAPHKPLYLLYCIASIQKGLPRLQRFEDVRTSLNGALSLFGLRTKTSHPEYPFWRLQNDNLAEVEFEKSLELRKSNNDPKVSSLLEANARGGLIEKDYDLLLGNLPLQSIAVHKILDAYFPASIHDEIIRYFDIALESPHSNGNVADKAFRNNVLKAYEYKCALTGFTLSFAGECVGVEATHICWPLAGGNDEVCNGIAMNNLFRKLYHLGLFTIDENYKIVTSSKVAYESGSIFSLSKVHGSEIRLPSDSSAYPNTEHLKWHMRWVYRG